ncbi:MAG: PQQ-binding-like beta-propeller repeat protein [Planctomycetota bacterium]|nr:PQQ-binding-like beta-propeller repeat protein [Planctomycetota bacterium]
MSSSINRFATLGLLSILPLTLPATACEDPGSDWPQWRGPDRTGNSSESGWSPTSREKTLWSKDIGFGHSSFAVANGRLFAMGYDLERKLDVVYCLNPETGEENWSHTYAAEFWNVGHDGGTCTTPTVDGDMVYTSNREGKLFALRADTGSILWQKDIQSELEVTPPRWGFTGSPIVLGDTIVMNVDKIAAYDKATGNLKWVTEKEYGNAYSTPIEYDFNGQDSVLVLNGLGLAVIDQADGSEITFYSWTRNPESSVYGATPVIIDDKIFISANAGGGCVMLEPNAENGLDVVWESRVMRSSYAGSVLHEGHIYGFDASILKCIDLDGNEKWRERGIGLGAVVIVGGRLLIIGAKGEMIIAEASPEKYIELSRDKILDGGSYWATPVLSHGLAYARNSMGDMVCRDYRSEGKASVAGIIQTLEDLPDATSILARHVTAVGGAEALGNLQSLKFTGVGERHGGGPIGPSDAMLVWTADGQFVWRFETGYEFGSANGASWSMSTRGPQDLDESAVQNLHEVIDLHRFLAPNWGFETVQTTDARVFDDRQCYVVEATKPDGAKRTLYFEFKTGRLAGQEGEDTSLWVYNDYREINGVSVPMTWSFFAQGSGSMTMASFSEVSSDAIESTDFDPPEIIRLTNRTPEEKQQATKELKSKYSYLEGDYSLTSGSMAGTPIKLFIEDGVIQFQFATSPADYLTEPDEDGRMVSMTNGSISVAPNRNDDGELIDLMLYLNGNEIGRIERGSEVEGE